MDKDTIQIFFEDANEGLDLSIDEVIELEEGYKEKIVDEIMRTMHSIKGGSGMLKLNEIEHFSHKLEDLFVEMKAGSIKLDVKLVDIIIESLNLLKKWVILREEMFQEDDKDFMKDVAEEKEEMNALIKKLENTLGIDKKKCEEKKEKKKKAKVLKRKEKGSYRVDIYFDETAPMFSMKRVIIKRNLESQGTILDMSPEEDKILDDGINYFKMYYRSEISKEELVKAVNVSDVSMVALENENSDDVDVYIRNEINQSNVHIAYDILSEIKNQTKISKIIKGKNEFDIYGIQILEAMKKDEKSRIE